MGNVLATSKPITSTTGPLPPPTGFPELSKDSVGGGNPAASATTLINDDVKKSNIDNELTNPGTVEEIHKRCKEIMPTHFEGAKLMIQKGLSNHFQVSHTIALISPTASAYRFGATYVGTKQLSPTEAFPILLGDIDPSGNLNANIIHQFTDKIRCKFASQIQSGKLQAAQLTTDYKGNDFTASLTVGNPNLINNSGVFVAHYLQSVTKKLALGGELAYQYGPAIPGGEIAVVSAAGRYVNGLSTWSGTVGIPGVHFCYYRKASEQLQLGVELEANVRAQEALATIGYQIDLPKADVVFRGSLDTNWEVSAVLEKRLQPLPFTFALSALLNHRTNRFQLGVGMIIG